MIKKTLRPDLQRLRVVSGEGAWRRHSLLWVRATFIMASAKQMLKAKFTCLHDSSSGFFHLSNTDTNVALSQKHAKKTGNACNRPDPRLCIHASHFRCIQLRATLWTVACQAPLSTGFSRQEYWSECHALLQGIFPTQGSNAYPYCLLHRHSFHQRHVGRPDPRLLGAKPMKGFGLYL